MTDLHTVEEARMMITVSASYSYRRQVREPRYKRFLVGGGTDRGLRFSFRSAVPLRKGKFNSAALMAHRQRVVG